MAGIDVLRSLFNKEGEQATETPPSGNDERSAFIRAQMAEGESLQGAEDLWRERVVRGGKGLAISGSSILSGRPIVGKKESEYTYLPAQVPQGPEEGINPFKLENIVNKVAPLPPKEETKQEAAKPIEEVAPTAPEEKPSAIEPPKNAPEMTALQEEIAAMEKSYGKHGEALKTESDTLMSQLADARAAYDESVKAARSDYEEAKARQQWAQVAEIIGRSLVGLVAAKQSLQKGRDFTQGLDPRSQVDWLGQLRESRADLQERIDAARRDYEGQAQVAGEGYKGRKAELETAFEGKQKGFGERIRELRQAEGRQYEEGQKAEQRAWQAGRDKAHRTATIDEATRMGIRTDVQRADAAAKAADLELDKWSKGLLAEKGKLREESKAKLIEKLVGWGAGPEEATKAVEDQETSWYQSGHVKTGGLTALSSYAKSLPGYPKRLDPRQEYAKARQLSDEGSPTTESSKTEESSAVQKPDTGAGMIPDSVKEALRAKGLSDEQINSIVPVASKEEAANLPSGTLYMLNGDIKRKK
jgi:hypothetical protein